MGFSQIKETCLYISDLDLAEKFYHGILKLPIIAKAEDRHIFFRAGSSVLLCFLPETTKEEGTLPPHFASGKQHIAFEVDAEEYVHKKKELTSMGISITHIQEWRKGLESFYFEDPFGHVLEVVPHGIWE
ncbi:VOC family protein [Pleomorphovibrio marinus]|uniref:VOC family protein n=1 Tax=Pleomorphovibrio marinus TaxID=2164132 RepID=UPI000E0B760C|nr:VOC family protein [Pleomorphovibrio marinus]